TDADWHEVQKQSLDIGFCLYDPPTEWQPEGMASESVNELQKEGAEI
ncbi:DUF438 domain-containing protein, partial [candidate division KSB1 bacterium]|nr:DUF438 domain-containing protein [candidate division KSB1 bacterium]NIU28534.1 DUF438 domain-containing protein [candidate division KSB1 bacterium]NIU91983.1 DUF438 domain-containing protein [candidate division KSB1 bacterium]NIV94536.1 DUF438 domain-containing protein [candidate division KSB1 bacterium]NIW22436.1 DUF438 domain-containing protein [candidate division KSB1 bacterium]